MFATAIWASYAEDDSESLSSVKFPSEDEMTSVPHKSLTRHTSKDEDSIVFTHDHDHTDREDKYVTENPKTDSLQVCN
jgi:hypothetical protein